MSASQVGDLRADCGIQHKGTQIPSTEMPRPLHSLGLLAQERSRWDAKEEGGHLPLPVSAVCYVASYFI